MCRLLGVLPSNLTAVLFLKSIWACFWSISYRLPSVLLLKSDLWSKKLSDVLNMIYFPLSFKCSSLLTIIDVLVTLTCCLAESPYAISEVISVSLFRFSTLVTRGYSSPAVLPTLKLSTIIALSVWSPPENCVSSFNYSEFSSVSLSICSDFSCFKR